MKELRVLLLFTCGFVCGCIGTVYLLPDFWPLLPFAAAVLLAILSRFLRFRYSAHCRIILIGVAVSLLWSWGYRKVIIDPVYSAAGTREDGYAEICSYSVTEDDRTKVEAYVHTDHGSVRSSLLLNNVSVRLKPGDRIIGDFRLSPSNQGRDGDEFLYYQSKGILINGYCTVKSVQSPKRYPVRYFPQYLSERIRNKLDVSVPADASGFMKALLTGDRSSLTFEEEQNLSIAGLSHIIAVSGMHASLLIGILYLILGKGKHTAYLGVPILVLFMLMTGMSTSVVRASIMLALVLVAPLVKRENDTPTSLSAAALVILLANPWAVSNTGFQLSFLAVAGLLLCSGPLYQYFRETMPWSIFLSQKRRITERGKIRRMLWKTGRKITAGILGSICATLGASVFTVPILANVFGRVASCSILSNILCLWAVGLCFMSGLMTVFLSCISSALGSAAGWITAWPVRFILGTARRIAHFSMESLPTSSPYTVIFLVFAYLIVVGIFLFRVRRFGKPLLCIFAVLFGAAFFFHFDERVRTLTITAIDVGQGSCICVRTDDLTAVIDCGGSEAAESGAKAAQYLRRAGVDQVDVLILSHYDRDHVGGVPELIREIPVKTVYLPDVDFQPETRCTLEEVAQKNRLNVQYVTEDIDLTFDNSHLRIFAPVTLENDNAASVSALFSLGDYDMLVTGDLDQQGEHCLLENHDLPDVEVFVAGHHGAATSSGAELLRTICPDDVLISVGKNSYGHPSREALLRFEQIGANVYRTDQNGTIEIRR